MKELKHVIWNKYKKKYKTKDGKEKFCYSVSAVLKLTKDVLLKLGLKGTEDVCYKTDVLSKNRLMIIFSRSGKSGKNGTNRNDKPTG